MRCFSNVLKKTLPPDVFDDVLEKVKHRTNDASNDVSRPALRLTERLGYGEQESNLLSDFCNLFALVEVEQ